jgi:HSP20 family molecular chaperone IbpA
MSERQDVAKQEEARPGSAIAPPVDVVEDNTGITLTADLPGVPPDKLTVRVDEMDCSSRARSLWTRQRASRLSTPRFRRRATGGPLP